MTVDDPVLSSYKWLVVVGALGAFFFGFGTGSNDVANAFGTSVGAKTLTLRQAVIIAAIFEFTGAMVLGRVSTSTISGGIADINAFTREPEVFAYGMVCALATSAIWQVVASYLELNVSSTHSIIGAILGFALVYAGNDAVLWQTPDPSSFPPYKGVVPIVVSWFFSPIFTAIAAALFFLMVRTLVLRHANAYSRAFWLLPPLVSLTVFICIFFVFTKGAKKTITGEDDTWTDAKSAWVSAIVAVGMGVLVAGILLPILKFRANSKFEEQEKEAAEPKVVITTGEAKAGPERTSSANTASSSQAADEFDDQPGWKAMLKRSYRKSMDAITYGTSVDIHAVVEEDELVKSIHAHAEMFDPKAEYALQYLQVFSAICVVFAHGAGEVGYMAGPLATIWSVYTEGTITKNVKAPAWVVLIGAIGLVIGLATYGYNVTRAMGVRLSKLSPSRGFCAELATALVIMICSQYGLPTSSSQCITGGIIGVGLLEGKMGVNWSFFGRQFGSWVATLFIVGLSTAALFAQGIYAPGKIPGQAQIYYEDRISLTAQAMFDNYRTTLDSYRAASAAGVIPRLNETQLATWSAQLAALSKEVKALTGTSKQTAPQEQVVSYLNRALALYQSDSILTVGQTTVFPGAAVCNGNVTADIVTGVTRACPAPKMLPKDVTGVAWS